MRFTIDEYSKEFKMSKEMVHSRLKTGKLNYIIEDSITYIIVSRSSLNRNKREQPIHEESTSTPKNTPASKRVTTASAIISLYQKENTHLKNRVKELEMKIDKLIDDKERMLIDERNRIESVYAAKDEQLKSVLELINTKLMLSTTSTTAEVESYHEVEPTERDDTYGKLIDLKSYLKRLELEPDEKKLIKKRFAKAYGHDSRVLAQNGQIYLDFSQYDYSDLLNIEY